MDRESADFVSSRLHGPNLTAKPSADTGISSDFGNPEQQTKFGLLGLLDVIRMTNADLNTLALGSDLTTLGLNLNSAECLYATFASPWAEAPTTREPQFNLPMCYYMQPPPLKTSCAIIYIWEIKSVCIAPISRSSNSRHYSTYFMPCPKMYFRHTLHKSCTIVTGNITKTLNSGSNVARLQMGSAPPIINTFTLTSSCGNVGCFQVRTPTSRAGYCLKMKYV
mmetsp:Transcript_4025/g.12513  ORF Transcript_4025/g.12513 Transcript_4025/m.12513 type:complete len:223 (+) Transcript_4025:1198-1866(+)